MTDKAGIEAKVRALLAKTEDAGCTEAEARAAAEKARQLIERHQIELGPERVREIGAVIRYSTPYNRRSVGRFWNIAAPVQKLYETTVFRRSRRHGAEAMLGAIGTPEDVEATICLFDLLLATEAREWATFQRSLSYMDEIDDGLAPATIRASFRDGFIHRFQQRVDELLAERQRAAASGTGTALVVVKKQLIVAAIQEAGLKLGAAVSASAVTRSRGGHAAGVRAGSAAPISGHAIARH